MNGIKEAELAMKEIKNSLFYKSMVVSTANKGMVYWSKDDNHAHVALARDDILMGSIDVSLYDRIYTTFNKCFDYTTIT